jgi:hypothetical protein
MGASFSIARIALETILFAIQITFLRQPMPMSNDHLPDRRG